MEVIKRGEQKIASRSKAIAIVLVIFFCYFAWLYTYKRDLRKFWIVFSVTLVLVLISRFTALYNLSYYVSFPVWIWVLIDVCIKPKSFYTNYPKG